jgi:MFS family permease
MANRTGTAGWIALLGEGAAGQLAVLLVGVLLHSMNVLITVTVLPSTVADIGGVALMSWPTAAYMTASIAAATGAAAIAAHIGVRRSFVTAAVVFALGTAVSGVAPAMAVLVAGRLVQGLGGGLLSALAYVMVRVLYPEALWPRAFALISGIWGVSVLVGPLVGGLFAGAGLWRGAFFVVAAMAAALSGLSLVLLPRRAIATGTVGASGLPGLRLALITLAIGSMSAASIAAALAWRAALIALALACLVAMARLDGRALAPLLPSDAFSPWTAVGAGLWAILLLSVSNDPFPIYGPLFLQGLHGLAPLAAGYLVAGEAMSWTVTAIFVASLPRRWIPLSLIGGPLVMAVGLLGIGAAMPQGPLATLFLPIYCAGAGIGGAWAFIAQGVMSAARCGEEDRAAAAVAVVQQIGLALGAALAGLVANLAGLGTGGDAASMRAAAYWVPGCFALTAASAAVAGARMHALGCRSL